MFFVLDVYMYIYGLTVNISWIKKMLMSQALLVGTIYMQVQDIRTAIENACFIRPWAQCTASFSLVCVPHTGGWSICCYGQWAGWDVCAGVRGCKRVRNVSYVKLLFHFLCGFFSGLYAVWGWQNFRNSTSFLQKKKNLWRTISFSCQGTTVFAICSVNSLRAGLQVPAIRRRRALTLRNFLN